MKKYFKKVLVANRGEIAVRIFRALRELSIPSVAIYSDADKNSFHIKQADEALHIGESEAFKSYLNIDKIIETAKKLKCDAIHPGYGFLAENSAFTKRCIDEKITFIGPKPESIKLLGDKIQSRKAMEAAGIPTIPGISKKLPVDTLIKESKKIGFPVLIKAASGGGGKGMRVVRDEKNLKDSILAAQREAKSAFSDETVFVEKYLENPRHVEIQIFGDSHGNAVHCYERECSVQRRHQKVVEESPSPALNDKLREEMGTTAVKVAKAVNYLNAGTVEFLLDKNKEFYFLEVNTRIQVEHPVTEMILGIDLVKEQIAVASGEKLSFTQSDLSPRGHAIECRIYAEDPENNFLPAPGKIELLREPYGPGIRVDSGVEEGQVVPIFYDPILSKLIVHDSNRESAIKRMQNALSDYIVLGVKTPIPFLKSVLNNDSFKKGQYDTSLIDENFKDYKIEKEYSDTAIQAMTALAVFKQNEKQNVNFSTEQSQFDPWLNMGRFEFLGDE